jgi:hypothetical protein
MQENVCRICLLYLVENQLCVKLLESQLLMEIYQNITGIQVNFNILTDYDGAFLLENSNIYQKKLLSKHRFFSCGQSIDMGLCCLPGANV